MKLCTMICRATQDGWVIVKSSDKMWSTGGGNGKTTPVFHMNSMKRQKDMIPEDEPARLEGLQYATGEEWRAIAERMKHLG